MGFNYRKKFQKRRPYPAKNQPKTSSPQPVPPQDQPVVSEPVALSPTDSISTTVPDQTLPNQVPSVNPPARQTVNSNQSQPRKEHIKHPHVNNSNGYTKPQPTSSVQVHVTKLVDQVIPSLQVRPEFLQIGKKFILLKNVAAITFESIPTSVPGRPDVNVVEHAQIRFISNSGQEQSTMDIRDDLEVQLLKKHLAAISTVVSAS